MGEGIATGRFRVQLDLDQVPRPRSAQPERSFDQSLSDARESLRNETPQPTERVDSRNPETAAPETPVESSESEAQQPSSEQDAPQDHQAAAGQTAGSAATEAAQPLTETSEEGSGRRITPGKGPDPSSTSNGSRAARSAAGTATATTDAPESAATAGPVVPVTQPTAAAVASTPTNKIAPLSELRQTTATLRTTKPGPTGFKTYSAQAMELEAKTKDSMFRQIALQLLPEGGRMRMRLDPGHLGNLDVNLIVEKGSVVALSLAAERSDVANLLERNLPELKQLLSEHGLTVDDAAVFTEEFGQHGFGPEFGATGESNFADEEESHDAPVAPQEIITAEGLDFWA